MCLSLIQVGCHWVTICLYFVVMGLSLGISNSDSDLDLTLYTQAINDWKNPGWLEAAWGNGACPDGYEPVINQWHGTKPGNYTKNGVKVAGDDGYGYKISPLSPVA